MPSVGIQAYYGPGLTERVILVPLTAATPLGVSNSVAIWGFLAMSEKISPASSLILRPIGLSLLP